MTTVDVEWERRILLLLIEVLSGRDARLFWTAGFQTSHKTSLSIVCVVGNLIISTSSTIVRPVQGAIFGAVRLLFEFCATVSGTGVTCTT